MDFSGFQTTMSGDRGLPLDLLGTIVQPLPKMLEIPVETSDGVAIFGEAEDERQLDLFSPLEPKQEGQTGLAPPDLFSLIDTLPYDTSNEMISQPQSTAASLDISTVSLDSNTATQLGRFMSDAVSQQKLVTTSDSNLGHEILMQSFLTNQNFQQTMPVHVDPGLVSFSTPEATGPVQMQTANQSQRELGMAGPQTMVAAAAPTAGSSAGGKIKKPRKVKEHERVIPYPDEERERRRKNAIKAKEYRNKKKQEEDDLRLEISLLKQVNDTLTQEKLSLTRGLMAAKQVIERKDKELMEQKQVTERQNKEQMEQKMMLQQLLKQQFGWTTQQHNA